MNNEYNYISYIPINCIKNYNELVNKKNYICPLCNGLIYNNSVKCNKCLKTFCLNCYNKFKELNDNKNPCECLNNFYFILDRFSKVNLDKLKFFCPYCNDDKEYNYIDICMHVLICDYKEIKCPNCENLVEKKDIIGDNKINFKDINNDLSNIEIYKVEIFKLKNEIKNLQNVLEKLKNKNTNNNNNDKNKIPNNNNNKENNKNEIKYKNELIDKCKHFFGNIIPFFSCCQKTYPCYLCHNENEEHPYKFGNKVKCLICNNFYSDDNENKTCPKCKTKQMFKAKNKNKNI